MAGKFATSSGDVQLPSRVHVAAVNPTKIASWGLKMTAQQAVELATCVLAVAGTNNADGLIELTGHTNENAVTILRHYKRSAR